MRISKTFPERSSYEHPSVLNYPFKAWLRAMKNRGTAAKNRNPGGASGGGSVNVVSILGNVTMTVAANITHAAYAAYFVCLFQKNETATANCTMPTRYKSATGNTVP